MTIFDRTVAVARREREGGRRRLRGVACRVAQLERREREKPTAPKGVLCSGGRAERDCASADGGIPIG